MSRFFGKEEMDELNDLKQDLLGPLKSFVAEVRDDTVGDARRFYSAKAKTAKRSAIQARDKTKAQMAALKREQERLQKQRRAAAKKAAIVLVLLVLFGVLVTSVALSAHAAAPTQPAESAPLPRPAGYTTDVTACPRASESIAAP